MGNRAGSMTLPKPRFRRRSRLLSSSSATYPDVQSRNEDANSRSFTSGEDSPFSEREIQSSVRMESNRQRTLSLMASDGAEFQINSLPITFRWEGCTTTQDVFLCGSFNDWCPLAMERFPGHQDFTLMVSLAEGRHQYRYMVDGIWKHDPSAPAIPLIPGSDLLVNLIDVRMQDFRVFDAIALDDLKLDDSQADQSCRTNSDNEYGQEPDYSSSVWEDEREDQPATIPPYLMELNLNKCGFPHPRSHPCSRGSACEPQEDIPEPSHVMLKHLYSLSRNEGVMVLGTSVRFRQKKISTIYYKSMEPN